MDFEIALRESLERHLQATDRKTPPNLAESIRYSLLAPGKRIRPRLLLACARMLELPQAAAMAAACALEMVHCFTLIHDDLPCMDDDDYRRGRPSNHKQFGESIALLAGDGLMALAVDALLDAEPHVSPANLLRALRRLSWAMGPRGVIGGQAEEPLLNADSSLEDLRRMHAKKTGALFEAALLLPKDLVGIGSDSPQGKAIDQFAAELGLAFQVVDDLDDAAQDQALAREKGLASQYPPTTVLYYLPESDVRAVTLRRLRTAQRELALLWDRAADPLVQIADEVAKKLPSPDSASHG